MRRREKNRALMIRLDEWGDWERKVVTGLGYHSQTTEAAMIEMGGVMGSGCSHTSMQSKSPNYKPSPRCAEVDRAISTLPKKLKEAIYVRHFLVLKDEEINSNSSMSARHCSRLLKSAYPFLAGRLGYLYEV